MLRQTRRGWNIDTALTIALFLVVQAFLSGLSLGARADTLDPAGVICGSSAPLQRDAGGNSGIHLVDCCTLGCPMVGGAAAPEPESTPQRLVLAATLENPAPVREHKPGRFELSPLHSRAPPRV